MGDMDWIDAMPSCPVFSPTMKEFDDPLAYIRGIAPLASKYGICKLISPIVPAFPAGVVLTKARGGIKFTSSVQPLRLASWKSNDKVVFRKSGRKYSFCEYEKMANTFSVKKFSSTAVLPAKFVEVQFWQEMALGKMNEIEYGNDIEGSAFSTSLADPLGKSKWNLKDLPHLPNSSLRLLKTAIPGVTEPMLYIGMLFSMFAWHVEDHYLYSISYHHCGASKTWYGVPGHAAPDFEKVVQEHVYDADMLAQHGKDATYHLLNGKTTMFPPKVLYEQNVPVYRAVQEPGQFIITFPQAYHAGFSHGFNCAEAVNFAMVDWFPFGAAASQRYQLLNRMPLLPHEELLCKEAMHIAGKANGSTVDHAKSSDLDETDDDLERPVKTLFVQLMKFQQQMRLLLMQRGARMSVSQRYNTSVTCGLCKHMCYVTFLKCPCFKKPICLNHEKETDNCKCGTARSVVLNCNISNMEAVKREFERADIRRNESIHGPISKGGFRAKMMISKKSMINTVKSLYDCCDNDNNVPNKSRMSNSRLRTKRLQICDHKAHTFCDTMEVPSLQSKMSNLSTRLSKSGALLSKGVDAFLSEDDNRSSLKCSLVEQTDLVHSFSLLFTTCLLKLCSYSFYVACT
ncbi:hypothetical protein O6H91_01G104900 [Diphasiastrum complanatum]|uniref:Uncharacterized protein n=1 Tax=Diphasiastrum complanatum TaxID=34168 RepID=A0ACC2EUC7_DIPCM|nr:hypothetical protein O6H91_01G104900 [Diphasiastrum complanatum]